MEVFRKGRNVAYGLRIAIRRNGDIDLRCPMSTPAALGLSECSMGAPVFSLLFFRFLGMALPPSQFAMRDGPDCENGVLSGTGSAYLEVHGRCHH